MLRDENVGLTPALRVNLERGSVIESELLRLAFEERLLTIHGDSWIVGEDLDDLPGEPIASESYLHSAREQRLVRLGPAIAHAVLTERSLTVRIAAPDLAAAQETLERLRAALPEVAGADQEVPVRFWWWEPHVAQDMARMMPSPGWADIRGNYAARTGPEVEPVMSWSGKPPHGGRLMLWHGAPGTGKTTAIRALAWEWRAWSEFQFITDPEQFLRNPSYLLRTISEGRTRARALGRWRVLVLEDAGEYMAPDAKHVSGQALSRLLNVCDGVLGQATRSLVLVTTNEPLRSLHPALSRPGRCLAETEFEELGRAEIDGWCAERDLDPPPVSRCTLADLYAHVEGRTPITERAGFGFSRAA